MLDGNATTPARRIDGPKTDLSILAGVRTCSPPHPFLIRVADDRQSSDAYRALRHVEFVERQQLFDHSDHDDTDDDPRTVVLVAATPDGEVIGGVRLAPGTTDDIGWWSGSRLVVADPAHAAGIGAALVRAACAYAETHGVLRFDATVQDRYAPMFRSLGWLDRGDGPTIRGRDHRRMQWPIGTIQRAADSTKAMLAEILSPLWSQSGGLGGNGFRGDDGAPVPDSDVIAACDAILPAMVERDPEWAGWCSVLVSINDLTAMGARPLGLLDAVGAPTRSHLTRVVRGIAAAAQAWRTPVLGGHTQVGVHASLSVTALGQTERPIPGGGGRVGDTLSLIADLGGSWRPGYQGRQWDSTSARSADELARMARLPAEVRPAAAKDVSMAGIAGTLGMLAEASGTGAELDVAAVPRPDAARMGEWLTCFPGYAMLIADRRSIEHTPAPTTARACGRLTSSPGVRLRWPDGEVTVAVGSTVTGLGAA